MKIDIHKIEIDKSYYVCAAIMNRAFDRFERIQKPVLVEYKRPESYRDGKNLFPVKGKPFCATYDLHYFTTHGECVEYFNALIDKGTGQYLAKIEQMQAKLAEMLNKKIK